MGAYDNAGKWRANPDALNESRNPKGFNCEILLAYDCCVDNFYHFGFIYGCVVIAKRLVCIGNLLFGKAFCFGLSNTKV